MDIIQEKKRYFHLNDATVITLFTEFCIIGAAGGDRTRKKRDLAEQLGCSLSTIYRIFRQSRVILAYPSDIRKQPVPQEVLDCNGFIRRRIKKGTDINTISREQTIELNRVINSKRRKLFQHRSARDMFFSILKNIGIGSNEVYLYQW